MSDRMKQFCSRLRFKSIQLFIVAGSVVISVLISLLCIGLTVRYEVENEVTNLADVYYWKDTVSPEQSIWYDKGIDELKQALKVNWAESQPKSVQIFVINGITASALAAARFANNQTDIPDSFVWETFSHVARLKSSCSCSSPCNAASVFKAFWSGVPLAASLNMDNNCSIQAEADASESAHMRSMLRQAQLAGLRTGFVTNQRLTGPTGAALYAHAVNSNWECDGLISVAAVERGCEDVATQLISSETGKALNVLLGGGRQLLNANVPTPVWDPIDELLCRAKPGRNLLRDWRNQKQNLKSSNRFDLLQHASELSSLNVSSLDYLLGVFANADLSDNSQAPTLQLMLNKTLHVLTRPDAGHFLIVEQVIKPQMDAKQQLKLINHTLSIFLWQKDVLTLVLLNNGNYLSSGREESEEIDILQEAFVADDEWQLQHKLQQMSSESLLFAQGPKSSLFCGVHDETYLAHALSYALGLDVFSRQL